MGRSKVVGGVILGAIVGAGLNHVYPDNARATSLRETVEWTAGMGYNAYFSHNGECRSNGDCAWFLPTRSYCIARSGRFTCKLYWNKPVTNTGSRGIRVRCIRHRGTPQDHVDSNTLRGIFRIAETRTYIDCRKLY